MPLRLALFEPDIPQNAATLLRLGACLGIAVDIVEPCGFVFGDRNFRRTGMDYLNDVDLTRHASWTAFCTARGNFSGPNRLILLTTSGETPYCDFSFHQNDTLLLGRESAGVPDDIRQATDAQLCIPMKAGMRSINVALAAAMVLGEALRQTGGFET